MPQTNGEPGGIIVQPTFVQPVIVQSNTGHPARFRHCA
jgi:hypothetical protein